MGYDCGDSFPLDFEPNGIPFISKSKEKLSPRSYPIQCERKWKQSFLSAPGAIYSSVDCSRTHKSVRTLKLEIFSLQSLGNSIDVYQRYNFPVSFNDKN